MHTYRSILLYRIMVSWNIWLLIMIQRWLLRNGGKQPVRDKYRINQRTTEPYSPRQNRAELDVREIKRSIRRFTKEVVVFLGELVAALRGFFTAHDVPKMQVSPPGSSSTNGMKTCGIVTLMVNPRLANGLDWPLGLGAAIAIGFIQTPANRLRGPRCWDQPPTTVSELL